MDSDAQIRGERLHEERKRLGWSQQQAAAIAGIRREMWARYEAGAEPGAKALSAIAAAGADVLYILTGERSGAGLGESAVHQAVLDAVELLSLEKKVDAQQLAKAVVKLCAKGTVNGAQVPSGAAIQNFHAPVRQVAGRDIVNQGERK
jgi:transcriptional regulator with XRE-family HTH domain